jgi:quercetin dioxygenase-like cupin family protein
MSEARIEASQPGEPIDLTTIARHVGQDEVPWVRNPLTGADMRLLQVRPEDKMWVLHGRMPAGMKAERHRHTGPVLGFTMNGAWRYLEHEFVNRAGSYLYEPAGSEHTLRVDTDGPAEALFVMYGEVLYLDPDDEVVYVSNAQSNLAFYLEACEEAGFPRPDAILG